MITDHTKNNLTLLAYNELPENQAIELQIELALNEELKAVYNEICASRDALNTFSLSPSETSIQIILEESCSSSSLEAI